MKIAYYSTFLNHHQIEFCDRMYQIHGSGFKFISTNKPPKERIKQGFTVYQRPYEYYEGDNLEFAEKLFIEADIVILAVHRDQWLKKRIKQGKVTFLHQERLFKQRPSCYKWLRSLLYVGIHYRPYRKSPFFMLAASAYTKSDYYSLGCFKNRCFEWGYFPPIEQHELAEIEMIKKHDKVRIVWSGRLIKWKHPEYAIEVARSLNAHGIQFNMEIIGDGEEYDNIHEMINRYSLNKQVSLLGFMPQYEVRKHMLEANIYLFTSNREEGYGAVSVEAMNAACVVIGSETAGATPFLIKDGYNGYIYRSDSIDELCEIALKISNDQDLLIRTGISAYKTITMEQNGIVAANRFSEICSNILNKRQIEIYNSGPMMNLR